MAGIDVATYATGGTGTSANPYTGWEGTTPWAAQKLFYFRPGEYYQCATALNWAYRGIIIEGNGATIALSGSGYVSIEMASSIVYNVTVSDLIIKGTGSTACPLKLQGIAESHFTNIHVGDCATIGISLKFVLVSRFESVSVSINNGYFTSMPADGIVLDERAAGSAEDTVGNVFVACTFEGVSGAGIRMVHASTNTFLGGTSEGNGAYGIYLATNSDNINNVFDAMHLESNGTADIYCVSILNTFREIRSNGAVKCGDGGILAYSNRFLGGAYYGAFSIDGHNNVLENVNLNGTLTDNSTTTRYVGDNAGRPSSIVSALQTSPYSASPTLSGVTGLGTGSAAVLTRSSDLAGIIELTAGTSAGNSGNVVVTLQTTFSNAPAVVLQQVSGTGSWNAASASPKITALTTNTFTIAWTNGGTNLTNGSRYRIAYVAVGRR